MYSIAKNIQIVIAALKAHNIKRLVLSPGGTNAPFIRNVQNDPFFDCYSIVDERSALYFAIGIYLKTKEPVAVCCTSAQATRNYIPGLTEAFYKHAPILAITFSKHYRFIGQDYMQAPNQVSLPVDSVKFSYALPYVSNEHDFKHCSRLANEAMINLVHRISAPIQLNIPMLDNELSQDTVEQLPTIKIIKRYTKDDVCNLKIDNQRILIVVGENTGYEEIAIEKITHNNNVVIYVNHLSNIFDNYTIEGNLLLTVISQDKFDEVFSPDILITIGGQTGDYPLYNKLTKGNTSFEHWRISSEGDVVDTYDRLTRVFECTPKEFFDNVSISNNNDNYRAIWKEAISKLRTDIKLPLSNAYTAQQLCNNIPEGSYLNFAILNSLRVWNLFHLKNKTHCFCNVGAFGIDGCLSTFIGQSVMTDELCYMIIGDLAFYYDMNALGIRHIKNNVRIILVNNKGGIEFKYGAGEVKGKEIDRYIAASGHFKNAEGWSKTNGFCYYGVNTTADFDQIVNSLCSPSDRPIIVEVFTTDIVETEAMKMIISANDNRSIIEKLLNRIKRDVKKTY